MAVCAQDFPWQPPAGPARRAPPGALGWGKAHASAPAEDELYSHFHTCASHFPAAEECGGGFRNRPSLRGGWVRVLARGSAEQGQWIFPARIQGSLT